MPKMAFEMDSPKAARPSILRYAPPADGVQVDANAPPPARPRPANSHMDATHINKNLNMPTVAWLGGANAPDQARFAYDLKKTRPGKRHVGVTVKTFR